MNPAFNKIILVNGKIGFGSPPAGKPFWKDSFLEGAEDFFPGRNSLYFTEKDFNYTDDTSVRFRDGKDYARQFYDKLTSGMQKRLNNFRFVSHSMGSAFAEGIKEVLVNEGWEVDFCVHINPWQPGDIKIAECRSCFVIVFQNTDDPLKYMITNKRGFIDKADLTIRESSGYKWYQIFYKHRCPIHKGRSFWKLIENELPSRRSISGENSVCPG